MSCAGADSDLCSPAEFTATSGGKVISTYFKMGYSKDAGGYIYFVPRIILVINVIISRVSMCIHVLLV